MAAFLPVVALPARAACVRSAATCMAKRPAKRRGGGRRARRGREEGAVPRELAEQFEEDVKERLEPGSPRGRDRRPREPGPLDRLKEFDVRKLTREQVLDLLIRGTWVGIGVLVGYFVVVHFVIVRDLLPH